MTELERRMELQGRPISRPVTAGELWAPRLQRVDGDCLVFNGSDRQPLKSSLARVALRDLMRLAEGSPEDISCFCRRYGVPILCEHGLPPNHKEEASQYLLTGSDHTLRCEFPQFIDGPYSVKDEQFCMTTVIPAAAVQLLARKFVALVTITSELYEGRTGDARKWHDADPEVFPNIVPIPSSIHDARFLLEETVDSVISVSGLRPVYCWDRQLGEWRIDLGYGSWETYLWGSSSLFALLLWQLLLVLADKEGYAVCSGCHLTYIPSRTPASDRRHYCPKEECQQARSRDAQRDRRAGKPPRWRNRGRWPQSRTKRRP